MIFSPSSVSSLCTALFRCRADSPYSGLLSSVRTYRRSMPFQSVHLSSFFSLLMSAALIQSLKNTAGITVKIVATQQQISKIAIHSGDCPAMICLTEKIISKIKRTICAISHMIPRTILFAKFFLSIEITSPHQFTCSVAVIFRASQTDFPALFLQRRFMLFLSRTLIKRRPRHHRRRSYSHACSPFFLLGFRKLHHGFFSCGCSVSVFGASFSKYLHFPCSSLQRSLQRLFSQKLQHNALSVQELLKTQRITPPPTAAQPLPLFRLHTLRFQRGLYTVAVHCCIL